MMEATGGGWVVRDKSYESTSSRIVNSVDVIILGGYHHKGQCDYVYAVDYSGTSRLIRLIPHMCFKWK
jgi:hypothetical protein